jgi:hypothetical protein
VHNVEAVNIFYAIDYLLKKTASLLLLYFLIDNNIVEELTATGVLHD